MYQKFVLYGLCLGKVERAPVELSNREDGGILKHLQMNVPERTKKELIIGTMIGELLTLILSMETSSFGPVLACLTS